MIIDITNRDAIALTDQLNTIMQGADTAVAVVAIVHLLAIALAHYDGPEERRQIAFGIAVEALNLTERVIAVQAGAEWEGSQQ